jgi:hypothetical protein
MLRRGSSFFLFIFYFFYFFIYFFNSRLRSLHFFFYLFFYGLILTQKGFAPVMLRISFALRSHKKIKKIKKNVGGVATEGFFLVGTQQPAVKKTKKKINKIKKNKKSPRLNFYAEGLCRP